MLSWYAGEVSINKLTLKPCWELRIPAAFRFDDDTKPLKSIPMGLSRDGFDSQIGPLAPLNLDLSVDNDSAAN
jgi:hypothetical protein